MTTTTVKLGDRTDIPVVPQRHARMRNVLSNFEVQALLSKDYGKVSYGLLCKLIPAIDPQSRINREQGENNPGIPLWEWEGYGSPEAMEAGDYNEDLDKSPTTAEIVQAIETCLMVAGMDRLGKVVTAVNSISNLTTDETPTES